jgi:hypothetical protein
MFGSQSIEPVNTIRGGVADDGGATWNCCLSTPGGTIRDLAPWIHLQHLLGVVFGNGDDVMEPGKRS